MRSARPTTILHIAPWGAATLKAHCDREGIPAPSAATSGRILCHLRTEGRIDDLDDEKYWQKQPRPLHPLSDSGT